MWARARTRVAFGGSLLDHRPVTQIGFGGLGPAVARLRRSEGVRFVSGVTPSNRPKLIRSAARSTYPCDCGYTDSYHELLQTRSGEGSFVTMVWGA